MDISNHYKILIVDDEPDTRRCVRSYLEKRYPVDIVDASDGQAAVDLARAFDPDLIILDIHMPKLDGWGVIKAVREFNKKAKIVIITGWEKASAEELVWADTQVAAFIHKPLVLEDVVRIIVDVLGPAFNRSVISAGNSVYKGRDEARSIVHELANFHSRIRIKCEYFISNLEQGYFKDKTDQELLKESVDILKDIVSVVDTAKDTVEKIRQL